jgi:hypothetical protein
MEALSTMKLTAGRILENMVMERLEFSYIVGWLGM